MAKVGDVLDYAREQIGYYAPSDPEPGSAAGRWMADVTGEDWLRGPSDDIWWCCCWVSMVMGVCGVGVDGLPSYNTDIFLANNPDRVTLANAKPGDIVVFDWDGNGATDHIGIIETASAQKLVTIEGNYRNSVARVDRTGATRYIAAVVPVKYEREPERPIPEVEGDYVTEMALRVIDGDYGNGGYRSEALYQAVQKAVNELMYTGSAPDPILKQFAEAVINGDYGNGDERRLLVYNAVQSRVNDLLN